MQHCKAKEKKCNSCGTVGHFQKVCKNKKTVHVNQLREEELNSLIHQEEPCTYYVCNTNTINKLHVGSIIHLRLGKPLIVKDEKVTFEVDTGAAVTSLSKKDYQDYFKNSVKLTPCELNLQKASDGPLSVLRLVEVSV